MKRIVTVFCLILLTVGVSRVYAQFGGLGGKDHPPRLGMERIESYKKVRLMEVLKLDENVSLKFMAKYNKHQESIRGLEKEANELISKLDQQIQDGAGESDFDRSFISLVDVSKRIGETRAKFLFDLKEILTNKQIAEYLVFERNFARDLREIIRNLQKDRIKDKQ
jgi:hypothetical protein